MAWGLDLHKCSAQEYYKCNPYAKKWDIDKTWFGFALLHGTDDIRIVYCPWCGEKLDKDAHL